MKANKTIIILVIAVLAMVSLGCSISGLSVDTLEVGELKRETKTVMREDAESVRVDIRMGAGEMTVNRSDGNLMDAELLYNVAEWEPEISYEVNDDGEGRLEVHQPNTDEIITSTDFRYEWRLAFSDDIPMEMRIECGAGSHDIDLAGLRVTQLDLNLGAGEVDIDLSDNVYLETVDIDLGAGDVAVDLSGPWPDNADIDIQGGVGQVTLRLPSDIGVRVNVTKGIGDVDSSGLYNRDGEYYNAAWDDADERIEVNVQAGVGQIVLDVVE